MILNNNNALTALDINDEFIYFRSLYNNPLSCVCRLVWLPLWLTEQETNGLVVINPGDMQCKNPGHAKGKALNTLTLDEFGCGAYVVSGL